MKRPPYRDFAYYQYRKHGEWREVPPPTPPLEAPVADSHTHVHSLPDPAWELVRCAVNGVDFLCDYCDPSEDGTRPYDELADWLARADRLLSEGALDSDDEFMADHGDAPRAAASAGRALQLVGEGEGSNNRAIPEVRIAAGVHPHNAKFYTPEVEATLLRLLEDPRTPVLGEIGLDYYYDLSPRETQHEVFRRQIELAKQANLPIALHLRGGKDPLADNAHHEAFEILQEVGFPSAGTLLHCCALPPDELRPWIEADCYVAYGGALTFKSADAAREGARLVPENRLLVETDAPYMTPEPMRGVTCTPAHVIFTAAALADIRGIAPGPQRKAFLSQLRANTATLLKASTAA